MGLFDSFRSADAIYEKGLELDAEKKYTQAFQLYKKAADRGHAGAAYNTACDYQSGIGVEKDLTQAFRYFKKAGELGAKNALFHVAFAYATGQGVAVDLPQAIAWYRKDYEANHEGITASNLAGNLINLGQYDEALEWALLSGDLQYDPKTVRGNLRRLVINAYACALPGYEDYRKGFALENSGHPDQAIPFYQKACAQHHPQALYQLGMLYYTGEGVALDKDLGAKYCLEAAEAGFGGAFFRAGFSYATGEAGLEKDDEIALYYFWKYYNYMEARDEGDYRGDTSSNISLMLRRMGCRKSALEWAKKSKEDGFKNADSFLKTTQERLLELPDYADNGDTLFARAQEQADQGNLHEAFLLYRRAADLGHPQGALKTGIAFLEGEGAPKLADVAEFFFREALGRGVTEAGTYLYKAQSLVAQTSIQMAPAPKANDSTATDIQGAPDTTARLESAPTPKANDSTATDNEEPLDIAAQLESALGSKANGSTATDNEGPLDIAAQLESALGQQKQNQAQPAKKAENAKVATNQVADESGSDRLSGKTLFELAGPFLFQYKFTTAFLLLKEAMDLDYGPAALVVGLCYWTGTGTEADPDKTCVAILEAALKNVPYAFYKAGYLYFRDMELTTSNVSFAAHWYRKSFAFAPSANTVRKLVPLYDLNMLEDVKEMHHWADELEKLGEHQEATAVHQKADRLQAIHEKWPNRGEGIDLYKQALSLEQEDQNAQAIKLFRQAAEMGVPQAMLRLGFAYQDGNFVRLDKKKAVSLFLQAGDEGLASGYFHAGMQYMRGVDGIVDYDEAARLLETAFEMKEDNVNAYALALCYYAQKKKSKAEFWAKKAIEMGHPDARSLLYKIYLL